MTKHEEYITDYSNDGEAIVLLHGFLASSMYWRRLQPLLSASGYRVITIDLLGFGKAPKPKRKTYNYNEHLAHINNAITSLKLNQPFILAGHSMGALLAMKYTKRYKHNIASLILLHPPLFTNGEQAHTVLRATGAHYRFLLDSRFRGLAWGIIRQLPYNIVSQHTKQSREGSLERVIEVAECFDDLQELEIRTLLLIGSKDRKEYLENVKGTRLSSNIMLHVKPVSHHSPLLQPNLTLQTIQRFIELQPAKLTTYCAP